MARINCPADFRAAVLYVFEGALRFFQRGAQNRFQRLVFQQARLMAAYSIIPVSAKDRKSVPIDASSHTVGLIFAMRSKALVVDTTST
jgi:hypothetical protein